MAELKRRRRRGLSALQRAELRRELERELRRLGAADDAQAEGIDSVRPPAQGRAQRLLDAIRRVATPEFGVCHSCRLEIAYERLSVLPETTLCARCSLYQEAAVRV
jgi:RNA polymerase-binding transcription factor DksA